MSLECSNCERSNGPYDDSGDCGACDGLLCHRCLDDCLRGSHTYVCTRCWNDTLTPEDLKVVAGFLLKPHTEEYKSFIQVRKVLREQGELLKKPCVKLDEQEEDIGTFVETIMKRGFWYDASAIKYYEDNCDDEPVAKP